MLSEIDSRDLTEWQAFDELSPLDETRRLELAISKLTTMFYNANRDRDASEHASVNDFLPNWGESIQQAAELQQPAEVAIASIRNAMQQMRERQQRAG